MTNQEFREKFEQAMTGSIETKINNTTKLIEEATKGLSKQSILTSRDFYELGKRVLEDKIYDIIYKSPDGIWLVRNGRIDGYKYKGGWIDTGYLYNIAKDGMYIRDVFGGAECRDYYSNLKYLLDHSELETIDILKE